MKATKEMKPYYQLAVLDNKATLTIYGDITSWPWLESDVSSYLLSQQLDALDPSVSEIDVYINSYGGEVSEALAIYQALRRHPAQVTTYCDGFACSAASVIFMAGDTRVMGLASLLMIHPASSVTHGNAKAMRKAADDLDKITEASVTAYLAGCGDKIDRATLLDLMDAESWLSPDEAVQYGFATAVDNAIEEDTPTQSAREMVMQRLTAKIPDPESSKHLPVFQAFFRK